MMTKSRFWLRGCVISVFASAIIVWAGGGLLGENAQVLFFVVPVLAAWSGGLAAGLFATALSAVVGTYFFIDHTGLYISDPADRIRVATFVVVGGLISWLIESLHRARRHLEDRQQQLQQQQEQLAIEMRHRKTAEAAIREQEERIRMAVESADIGTWDLNVVTGERKWSARSKAMFGLPPEVDVSKISFLESLHPDDRQRVDKAIQAALSPCGSGKYEMEFRVLWPDGMIRWVIAKGQVFFEGEGQNRRPIRFIGTVLDITERKHAEESLKDADRRKDEFLAVLAHELRNPLAPIRSGLELLKTAGDDKQVIDEAQAVMERQVSQMVRLIDDLLDVSRITRGKLDLRREPIRLAEVIHCAVETSRPLLEGNGHELIVTLPPAPIIVDADSTRLAQVVSNLLNNSAKFTNRGGHIWLTVEPQGRDVIVRVKDTGIGIPAEMLPHVFEMLPPQQNSWVNFG